MRAERGLSSRRFRSQIVFITTLQNNQTMEPICLVCFAPALQREMKSHDTLCCNHPTNIRQNSLHSYVPVAQWKSTALAAQRSWVRFPGNTHTCIAWMHCKPLWIKASAKYVSVMCVYGIVKFPEEPLKLIHFSLNCSSMRNILENVMTWRGTFTEVNIYIK